MGFQVGASDFEYAQRLLEQSLALYQSLADRWATGHTLARLGLYTYRLGDFAEGRRKCQESLALLRTLNDGQGLARVLEYLRAIAQHSGRLDEAEQLGRESLTLMRQNGDRYDLANCASSLAVTLIFNGKLAQAQALLEEGLAIAQDIGHFQQQAYACVSLGYIALGRGQAEQAEMHLRDSLALLAEVDKSLAGISLRLRGESALFQEKYAEAQTFLQKSVTTLQQSKDRAFLGLSLASQAYVARALGQPGLVQQLLVEALQLSLKIGEFWALYYIFPLAALLCVDRGAPERAVELYALALCFPVVANSRWFETIVGRQITAAAATLPVEVVASAQERGRAREVWSTAKELLAELNSELPD
jgi:tetratricopeptide (TPR) repeat protein